MGIISFIKNAGAKVFGSSDTPEELAKKVKDHVAQFGFDLSQVTFAVESEKVVVSGTAKNLDEKQKIIVSAGNVEGIEGVDDQLQITEALKVEMPSLDKTFYTVKKGDTLSAIAKETLGDMMKYPVIFEANKPMLTHPDKIYPGQVLYIPTA